MKYWITLLAFLIGTSTFHGQIAFQEAHSGLELNEALGSVSVTTPIQSGGYITAVSINASPDYYYNFLIRLNDYGDTVWTKEYPISNIRHPRYIEQDLYGNIVIIGSFDVPQQNWADEVYFLKVDSLGTQLDYGSLSSSGNSNWHYPIGGIEIAYDSTYYVGQKSWSLSSNNSNLRKYNSTFNMQTSVTFGIKHNMNNFHENADHSVIMAGEGTAQFSSVKRGRIYKTDEYLNFIFFKDYKYPDAAHSYFIDITETDNGYAILGKYEDTNGDMHNWLVKTDINGDTTLNVDFPQEVMYKYIFSNADDDLVLFGGKADLNNSYNFYMSVMDTNFIFSEHHEFPYPGSNTLASVQPTADGGYVLSGNGIDPVDADGAAYVLKIGANYCIPAIVGVNDFINDLTICSGDSILFGSNYISSPGTYNELLTSSYGCDSSVVLNLFNQAPISTNLTLSICHDDSIAVGNSYFSTTGIHNITLQNFNGCDSTITLDLTVMPEPLASYPTVSACYGSTYTIGSSSYIIAGNYIDTIQNALGCDSIVNIDLSFSPMDTISFQDSMCLGSTYIFNGGGFTTVPGNYTRYDVNQYGCDSLTYVTLFLYSEDTSNQYETICNGESFFFGGQNYNQTGSYVYTGTNSNGCDSTRTLILTVLPSYIESLDTTLCSGESILFGGNFYSSNGNYTDSLYAINGCDSLLILNLSISNISIDLGDDQTLCDGDSVTIDAGSNFNSYTWNTGDTTQTITVSDSSYYYVEVTNSIGCSAIDTIFIDTDDCLSIVEQESNSGIKIYPNPSNGAFFIEADMLNADLLIIDMKGSIIRESKNTELPFKVIDLTSGMYIIQLKSNGIIIGEERVVVK